jgi:hypothetical protein
MASRWVEALSGLVVWIHPAFTNGHIYARNVETLAVYDLRK